MKVEVTEQDIKKGVPTDPKTCAIARSVKRTTRRRDVSVSYEDGIIVYADGFTMPPTQKIKEFMGKFDNGRTVKPFSFELKGYKRGK